MIGADEHWSAPDDFANVNSDDLEVQLLYFILHGSDRDPSTWRGEDLTNPLPTPTPSGSLKYASTTAIRTFEVEPADEVGIVVSNACYGAYLDGGQDPRDSLALRFLAEGARAFVSSTTTTYSCYDRFSHDYDLDCNSSLYMGSLMKRLVDGEDPLMAYFNAKYDFLDRINEMHTDTSPGEEGASLDRLLWPAAIPGTCDRVLRRDQTMRCPNCGVESRPGAQFCRHCAAPLIGVAAPGSAAPSPARLLRP